MLLMIMSCNCEKLSCFTEIISRDLLLSRFSLFIPFFNWLVVFNIFVVLIVYMLYLLFVTTYMLFYSYMLFSLWSRIFILPWYMFLSLVQFMLKCYWKECHQRQSNTEKIFAIFACFS